MINSLVSAHLDDRGILAAHSPTEIAETALRHLRRLLRAPRAALARYDLGAGDATWLAVDVESESPLAAGMRFPRRLMGDPSGAARSRSSRSTHSAPCHRPRAWPPPAFDPMASCR